MLIITRKIGESIIIGDDVYITLLGIRGNQIRLGIDAPAHILVNREEIHSKIKAEEAFMRGTVNWNKNSLENTH